MSLSCSLGSRRVAFQKILSGGFGVLSATRVGRSRGDHTRSLKKSNESTLSSSLISIKLSTTVFKIYLDISQILTLITNWNSSLFSSDELRHSSFLITCHHTEANVVNRYKKVINISMYKNVHRDRNGKVTLCKTQPCFLHYPGWSGLEQVCP